MDGSTVVVVIAVVVAFVRMHASVQRFIVGVAFRNEEIDACPNAPLTLAAATRGEANFDEYEHTYGEVIIVTMSLLLPLELSRRRERR